MLDSGLGTFYFFNPFGHTDVGTKAETKAQPSAPLPSTAAGMGPLRPRRPRIPPGAGSRDAMSLELRRAGAGAAGPGGP